MSDIEIRNIIKKLTKIEKGQAEIIKQLQGDGFGNPGVCLRLAEVELKITRLERGLDRIYWTTWVLIGLLSLIGTYITITL